MTPEERRILSKSISALLAAPPLLPAMTQPTHRARRIGFSGPPGSGKSSLIAAWARGSLSRARSVGVLAIDPSSPLSSGSLLGDRIRMDDVLDNDAFFVRSVPSRSTYDGLCPNAAAMLDVLESASLDDVVLETVGVGQADYAARALVDIFVVVLSPLAGDIVQAMKAGILEVADVVVVNKSDLPAAARMASELAGVISLRPASAWSPPVVSVSVLKGTGLEALDEAFIAHAAKVGRSDLERQRNRQQYRLRSALVSQIDQLIADLDQSRWDMPLEELRKSILGQMQGKMS